jgi:hypothetical protein
MVEHFLCAGGWFEESFAQTWEKTLREDPLQHFVHHLLRADVAVLLYADDAPGKLGGRLPATVRDL